MRCASCSTRCLRRRRDQPGAPQPEPGLSPRLGRGRDALSDGSLDVAALQRLFARTLPAALVEGRLLWALDGSLWPRPEAKTSPERTWGRFVTGGTPESGIVGGWEYQWLAAIPEASGSWVLPLAVGRRDLAAGTATTLAIRQLRAVQAERGRRGPAAAAAAGQPLRRGRIGRRRAAGRSLGPPGGQPALLPRPGPYRGTGAKPKHGPVFRLADPTTHGTPDRTQTEADPVYGTVTLDVWERLHTQPAPTIELTVIRVSLGRLPRREQPPKPLWLAWWGGALPADLRTLQRWYQRRFAIEHAFRFLKQRLGWTAIRPRAPQTADRWSWLLATGLWELWLAREVVADQRLPWERPLAAAARSGAGAPRLCRTSAHLGHPSATPPTPRKAPGRRRGQGPGPAPRCPVRRRGPPKAA